MVFSIDQFRAALDRQGGLARINVFEVVFSATGTSQAWNTPEFNNGDLKFFCQTVTFPGVSVDVFDYRPNNIEVAQSMPYAIGHQQLECVFMVDDRHKVMNYFHQWMRRISNYASPVGDQNPLTQPKNQFSYELGYKSDYAQSMSITMYSRSPVYENGVSQTNGYLCRLTDVYPVQVGSLTLSWNANDEYGTLPVSLSYGSMEMVPIVNGVIQDQINTPPKYK